MPPTGTIQFRVFTSDANLPLEGVTVVLRRQLAPYELLGVLVTDSSGQTPVLEIETCGADLSQTPDPASLPWTGLRAYVEHPDYEEAVLTGLQLFPDILTVQNIQLLPNQYLDADETDLQEYNTTPQPIYGGTAP